MHSEPIITTPPDEDENKPFLPDDPLPFPHHEDAASHRNNLRIRLIIVLFCIILAVETGDSMVGGPTTRIYESIACKAYYDRHDPSKIGDGGQVEEELCKNEKIQGEVAIVTGYGELFDALVGVVLAVPYGLLADKYGRKPIIALTIPAFLANIVLSWVILWYSDVFPLRTIWLTSLTWLCGGGLIVAGTMIWTMMSDVTTESQRAAIFFQFGVATVGSDFISHVISAWLMTYNPWIPMFIGWGCIVLGVVPTYFLPETMTTPSTKSDHLDVHVELSETSGVERDPHPLRPRWRSTDTTIDRVRSKINSTYHQFEFVFRDRQLLLLLSTFLVYRLSRGTSPFLVQYISKRYEWTIAKATFIVSLKSILTVILFIAILPAASWYLVSRLGLHNRRKDLLLTKASIVFLIIGTLGIGLSPAAFPMITSMLIQTLGVGFVFVTRSLITTMVTREQTARLYTFIELLEAIGLIISGPTVASFFKWGLEMGGLWIGLPWVVASVFFGLTALAVWAYRMPPIPHEQFSS